MKKNMYIPDYATAPGLVLFDRLVEEGESLSRFSERSGIDRLHLAQIIVGAQTIDAEVASKLHAATGVDADLWLGLEENFRQVVETT